jgi:hypothetical protein
VLGAAVTGYLVMRPSHHHSSVAASQAQAQAPALTPVAVTTQPPSAAPTKPAPPHQYVAPAAPTSFKLTGRHFAIKAHVCAMAAVFPLDPPGEQHHTVCWVQKGFGVRPGSHSATSYVLGHSWAQDTQEVLNKFSEAATREILHVKPREMSGVPVYPVKRLVGYRLVLTTPNGTLTYRVRDAFGAHKTQLGLIKQVMNQQIRNRIVLITCAELHGVDYDYNVVLDAYLVSSVRKPVT